MGICKKISCTFISLLVAISLLLTPTLCYAGSGFTTGPTGSATAGNAAGYVSWSNGTTGSFNTIDNIPSSYLRWYLGGCYQSDWIGRDWGPNVYGWDTYWAATLVRGSGGGGGSYAGKALVGLGSNSLCGDNCWIGSEELAQFFINNAKYCNDNVRGFYRCSEGDTCQKYAGLKPNWQGHWLLENYHIRVNSSTGASLFAVWIDSNKLYVPHVFEQTKEVVVQYTNDDDPDPDPTDPEEPIDPDNPFDCTEVKEDPQENSKWQYYNAPDGGTYHGVTPPEGSKSHNYSNNIKIKVKKVTKVCTVTCKPNEKPSSFEEAEKICEEYAETGYVEEKYQGNPNNKKYPTIEYKSDPVKDIEEEIKYTAETPELKETIYRPFNLNRNDYAEDGDGGLPSAYTQDDIEKIDGSVDNHQGIINDEDLNALDINNDTQFDLHFNNNQLGMTKYDYLTSAPELENHTWEYSGTDYANNHIGDYTDVTDGGNTGYYRYNLQLEASIGDNELFYDPANLPTNWTPGAVTSSLYHNEDEKVANEQFKFKTNNDISNWNGGRFGARFIISGKYSTDNESDIPQANTFKKYWVNTYDQSRFYEYGIEYSGSYDTNHIYSAHLVAPLVEPEASIVESTDASVGDKGITKFTTNGLTQRGLYVGMASKKFAQPILYGHWNVKTLAGDTRK